MLAKYIYFSFNLVEAELLFLIIISQQLQLPVKVTLNFW